MVTLIGIIVILAILFLPSLIRDYIFNNRISPDGYKTDWGEMNRDMANGKSKDEVKQKFNKGGYDLKK